jgi:ketosteroid isomerase-like protein
MKRWLLLPIALLVTGCCSMASRDFRSGDAETAIRRMDADFGTAVAANDVNGIMKMYDADSVLMAPNFPAFNGLDAIRQFWGGLLQQGKIEGTLTPDNIIQNGDLAVEAGRYDLLITPPGAAPVRDSGKYVVTWRRRNGQWKNVYDIFNTSMPER